MIDIDPDNANNHQLESDPTNLATEGIYRVPGDAAKIQKLRIDIDQVGSHNLHKQLGNQMIEGKMGLI